MAVDTAPHAVSWLLDLPEQQTVNFPQTGHIAVSLPVDLVSQIEHLASLERRTMRDWMVERLSECIQDGRSATAFVAEQLLSAKDIIERVKNRAAPEA